MASARMACCLRFVIYLNLGLWRSDSLPVIAVKAYFSHLFLFLPMIKVELEALILIIAN
jgi:hypothetical protein